VWVWADTRHTIAVWSSDPLHIGGTYHWPIHGNNTVNLSRCGWQTHWLVCKKSVFALYLHIQPQKTRYIKAKHPSTDLYTAEMAPKVPIGT
jgi:hypothetical protein